MFASVSAKLAQAAASPWMPTAQLLFIGTWVTVDDLQLYKALFCSLITHLLFALYPINAQVWAPFCASSP